MFVILDSLSFYALRLCLRYDIHINMQEDLKKIKEALTNWSMSLTKAMETNSLDDVKEVVKDTRVVESACDQLIFSLTDLKEMIDEHEYLK